MSADMHFRIDEQLKKDFEKVGDSLEMTSSALLKLFIKRTIEEQDLPFKKPSEEVAEKRLKEYFERRENISPRRKELQQRISKTNRKLRDDGFIKVEHINLQETNK